MVAGAEGRVVGKVKWEISQGFWPWSVHEKPLESFERRSDMIWLMLEKRTLCYIGNSKYVGIGRRVEAGRAIKGM